MHTQTLKRIPHSDIHSIEDNCDAISASRVTIFIKFSVNSSFHFSSKTETIALRVHQLAIYQSHMKLSPEIKLKWVLRRKYFEKIHAWISLRNLESLAQSFFFIFNELICSFVKTVFVSHFSHIVFVLSLLFCRFFHLTNSNASLKHFMLISY